MNKLIRTSAAVTLLLIALTNVAAQTSGGTGQTTTPPPRPLMEERPLDPGRLEGLRYRNDFFGISFTIPEGWTVQDSAERRAVLEMGKDAVAAGADARKKAQMDSAVARTSVLLSVMKHRPYAVTSDFNAHFACIAERVPTAFIRTGADYINLSLSVTQGSAVKMTIDGPVRSQRIGGRLFSVADVRTTMGGAAAAQRFYVLLSNGYALSFIYTYSDEADLQPLKNILASVAFKPQGRARR